MVCAGKLHTGKAFNHLDALRTIMKEADAALVEHSLNWCCGWVGRLRIPEMKRASRMIRAHWDWIVAYIKTRVSNGAVEAPNGIIQTVKRKSRGFKTLEDFRTMRYLGASGLEFDLLDPVQTTHT